MDGRTLYTAPLMTPNYGRYLIIKKHYLSAFNFGLWSSSRLHDWSANYGHFKAGLSSPYEYLEITTWIQTGASRTQS